MNKNINPVQLMRVFSVLNPILAQLEKSEKPDAIDRTLIAFHRASNKSFEIDAIPKEISVSELEYVVILKASYKSAKAAKEFFNLDEMLDKV